MFSSSTSRKPLLRSNSERGSMRHLPLFGFLFGLVFFFYIFYLYQAQNTELSMAKEQVESQLQQMRTLQNEVIDVKAELEKVRLSDTSGKSKNSDLTTKYDECTTSLRSCKLKADNVQLEKTKLEESIGGKDKELEELRALNTDLNRNLTALKVLAATQEALSNQLNQTVQVLQTEINSLKSGQQHPPSIINQSQFQPVPDAQINSVVNAEKNVAAPVVADVEKKMFQSDSDAAGFSFTTLVADTLAAEKAVDEPVGVVAKPMEVDQNQDKRVGEQPELRRPEGPGGRVKLEEEKEKAAAERPMVQGGDYDDKLAEVDKDDQDNAKVGN